MGKTDFKSFFHWYREREDLENEKIRDLVFNHKDLRDSQLESRLDIQLTAVRKAIEETLPEYGNFHVMRSPRKFVMNKNGVEFDFTNLSDGEKCYITLVGAIARKLAMTHPDSMHPLDERGIFIIDEIDLHLHPEWQLRVVPKLRKIFKNSQFFLTTHSPIVLSGVRTYDGERIFAVQAGEVKPQGGKIFGLPVQDILLCQFGISGLRAPEAEQLISKWRDKLAKGEINDSEYAAIKSELYNKMDPMDEDIVQLLLEERKLKKGV